MGHPFHVPPPSQPTECVSSSGPGLWGSAVVASCCSQLSCTLGLQNRSAATCSAGTPPSGSWGRPGTACWTGTWWYQSWVHEACGSCRHLAEPQIHTPVMREKQKELVDKSVNLTFGSSALELTCMVQLDFTHGNKMALSMAMLNIWHTVSKHMLMPRHDIVHRYWICGPLRGKPLTLCLGPPCDWHFCFLTEIFQCLFDWFPENYLTLYCINELDWLW